MKNCLKNVANLSFLFMLLTVPSLSADCRIGVGVLHSLSGVHAPSEADRSNAILLEIEQKNELGGLLGCELEAVVVDPASDIYLFSEKVRELITVHEVDVIFGGGSNAALEYLTPALEELDVLLFYPEPHHGMRRSANIFYAGGGPSQIAVQTAERLISEHDVDAFAIIGTAHEYSRITSELLRGYLNERGFTDKQLYVMLSPWGNAAWNSAASEVQRLQSYGRVGLISMVEGRSNFSFNEAISRITPNFPEIFHYSLSIGENDISEIDMQLLAGQKLAQSYFMSIKSDQNTEFLNHIHDRFPNLKVTPSIVAQHISFNLWMNAVEKAGSPSTEKARQAMWGQEFMGLAGETLIMGENHVLSRPIYFGEISPSGDIINILGGEVISGDYCPWCAGGTDTCSRSACPPGCECTAGGCDCP